MTKRPFLRALAALTVIATLAGCASAPQSVSVAETVARTPELSTLAALLQQSGLAETLRQPGPYTLFAPTNEAFKAVPPATMAKLGADKELLKTTLAFHVVAGSLKSAEIKAGPAKSVQGAPLALARAGTFVTVEDAAVQTPDLAASNGVVHLIDRVLTPPRK